MHIYSPCWAKDCLDAFDTMFIHLRFSVENAYIDEKEDACDALGEIAFNTGLDF